MRKKETYLRNRGLYTGTNEVKMAVCPERREREN